MHTAAWKATTAVVAIACRAQVASLQQRYDSMAGTMDVKVKELEAKIAEAGNITNMVKEGIEAAQTMRREEKGELDNNNNNIREAAYMAPQDWDNKSSKGFK